MIQNMQISEARRTFSELVDKVHYRGDVVQLSKRGKVRAFIVPAEAIDAIEDWLDGQAAMQVIDNPKTRYRPLRDMLKQSRSKGR